MKKFIVSMLLICCFTNVYGFINDTTNVDSTCTSRANLKNGYTVDGLTHASFSIGFHSPIRLDFSFQSNDGGKYDFSDIEHISKTDGTEKLSAKNVRRMSVIEFIVNNVGGVLFYYYIFSLANK